MGVLIVSRRYPADCEGAAYVGRPGAYGNPFKVGPHGSVRDVVALYVQWVSHPARSPLRQLARRQLRGQNLACWCAPRGGIAPDADQQLCHAQVLARIANAEAGPCTVNGGLHK